LIFRRRHRLSTRPTQDAPADRRKSKGDQRHGRDLARFRQLAPSIETPGKMAVTGNRTATCIKLVAPAVATKASVGNSRCAITVRKNEQHHNSASRINILQSRGFMDRVIGESFIEL
jgi:hypothetical protein